MRTKSSLLAGIWLYVMIPLFASSAAEASPSDASIDRLAAQQYEGAKRFRDVFRDVALKYDKDESTVLNSLLLPMPEGLRTPNSALRASSPRKALEAITVHGRSASSLKLYEHGVQTPFGERGNTDEIFAAKGPATFIVVPGMLQESLDDDMFAEITEVPNSFNQRYGYLLDQAQDFAYDWGELGEKDVKLSSKVRIGSLDDPEGKPLVQLIVLRSAFGSFETIGPIKRSAETYLRRINKILELLPPESYRNLYFVGFSRGTMISLEMLAKVYREGSYPLLRSLKGVITLGGVVYGSDLADYPFRPFQPSLPEKTAAPDPLFLMEQTFKLVETLLKNAWDPVSNLKRVGILAKEINDGANELKTAARLNWWATHELPPEVPIYSINGAMPIKAMAIWPFQDAPFYGLGDLDYGALKIMASKLQQVSGNFLNDGQLTDVKGRMWPGLAEKINPKQKPLKVQTLGNATTHHFGLGTRSCIQEAGGRFNLFPRKIMMEALGAYVLEQEP